MASRDGKVPVEQKSKATDKKPPPPPNLIHFDWDPNTPLPKDVKPKWVFSPIHKYCPKAGWETLLQTKYLCKKESNQQWRTTHGINRLIHKLQAHETYQNVKDETLKKKKRFAKNSFMPEALKKLKDKADETGKVTTETWAVEIDESKNPILYRVEKDTGIKWRMKGIEHSYEILNDLHVQNGHLSGTSMANYVHNKKIYSWPRDLVNKFPWYCLQCRKKYVNKCVRKMLEEEKEQEEIYQEIIEEKKESLIRQGDFTVMKVWHIEDLLILSALDMTSSYLQHNMISSSSEEDVYESVLTIFSNTMFPRRFTLQVEQDTKEKFERDWDELVSSISTKLVSLLPDYGLEQVLQLDKKQKDLIKDCFVDYMKTLVNIKSSSVWEKVTLASMTFNCNGKWSLFKNQLRDKNAAPIELMSQESVALEEKSSSTNRSSSLPDKTLAGYLNTTDPNPMSTSKIELAPTKVDKEGSNTVMEKKGCDEVTNGLAERDDGAAHKKPSLKLCLSKKEETKKKGSKLKRKRGTKGTEDLKDISEEKTPGKKKKLDSKKPPSTTPVSGRTRACVERKEKMKKGKEKSKEVQENATVERKKSDGAQGKVNESKEKSKFNFEDYEYSYDNLLGWKVGRSIRDNVSDNVVAVMRGHCNGCLKTVSRGDSIGSLAFVCRDCIDTNKVVLKKIGKAGKRVNLNQCTLCTTIIRGKPHVFGGAKICKPCVIKKKCPCYVCETLKPSLKTAVASLMKITSSPSNLIELREAIYFELHKDFLSSGQLLRSYAEPLDAVASVSLASCPKNTPIVQVYGNYLTLEELHSFGKYECINKQNRCMTMYMYEPPEDHEAKLSVNTFSFFGSLLSNWKVKFLGVFESLTFFNEALEKITDKTRLFQYQYLFFFCHHEEKKHMASYVIDIKKAEFSTYNSQSGWNREVMVIYNRNLNNIYDNFTNEEKDKYGLTGKCQLELIGQFSPLCHDKDNHKTFLKNTSFICLLHTWIFTTEEWTDRVDILSQWEPLVEGFHLNMLRQLFMLFAISGDTNLLLYKTT